jgi:hypothetical protein
MKMWRIRFSCWILKAIDTHPKYAKHIVFPRQKMVTRTLLNNNLYYIVCLFCTHPIPHRHTHTHIHTVTHTHNHTHTHTITHKSHTPSLTYTIPHTLSYTHNHTHSLLHTQSHTPCLTYTIPHTVSHTQSNTHTWSSSIDKLHNIHWRLRIIRVFFRNTERSLTASVIKENCFLTSCSQTPSIYMWILHTNV